MKIMMLGATGYIGGHVADSLAEAFSKVSALVRNSSDTARLEALGVHCIRSDFSTQDLRNALKQADYVVNCMASRKKNDNYADHKLVDVELTARVIECLPKTVKGFLQLSSVIAYGLGTEGMIDEFTPAKPVTFMDKAAAERDALIKTLCEKGAVPWLVLQPASAFGARDAADSLASQLLRRYKQGRFPLIDKGRARSSYMDVRDIGRAFVHFIKNGPWNRCFLLKKSDLSYGELKELLDKISGKREKTLSLSRRTAGFLAAVSRIIPLGISSPAVRTLSRDKTINDGAIRAAGFTPVYTVEQALRNMLSL